MAKFPFTNFFDVNGNGKMDFSEELLAMKVFEDTLHGNDLAFYMEVIQEPVTKPSECREMVVYLEILRLTSQGIARGRLRQLHTVHRKQCVVASLAFYKICSK